MHHATDQLFFTFDIEPTPQLRPRVSSRGGYVRVYDPPKVANFKRILCSLAVHQYARPPLLGALSVSLTFYRPVQKSISKTERERRLSNRSKPVVKPDTDNYIKSTLDALNGILWHDDAQIVKITGEKRYSDHPKITVSVKPM
ncbi:RusA family crossover junction endodeoxyribonuclease [Limosilactobacillus oris]|uniref:RusA family crossover junction endodeoxyribonuclease n=1 Tax=Limosilactobacillus oris TaxID=1632 RepID=UPI0032080793